MEFMSTPWWSALLALVLIDLALAVRNLPAHLQKKATFFGALGAIVVRSLVGVDERRSTPKQRAPMAQATA